MECPNLQDFEAFSGKQAWKGTPRSLCKGLFQLKPHVSNSAKACAATSRAVTLLHGPRAAKDQSVILGQYVTHVQSSELNPFCLYGIVSLQGTPKPQGNCDASRLPVVPLQSTCVLFLRFRFNSSSQQKGAPFLTWLEVAQAP